VSPWWLRPPGDESDEAPGERPAAPAPASADPRPATIADLFAAELDGRPAALAAVDVLCSFESVDLLLHDQRLTRRRAARTLTDALRALLEPGGTRP